MPAIPLSTAHARAVWLHAQGLHVEAPFGRGPGATPRAVQHLGYVQIDTIHVIERSHHHILYTRIPSYSRTHLERAQSRDKSLFEYWTHALAYIPSQDFRCFVPAMNRRRAAPPPWYAGVDAKDYASLLERLRVDGPLTIRDFDGEALVEKTHPWGSRKPSKRALGLGFFIGDLTISKRSGMVKTYDLAKRHFGWRQPPKPVTEEGFARYLVSRALRSQGVVSRDSICYGNLSTKPTVSKVLELAVRRKRLVPVALEGNEHVPHWAEPSALEAPRASKPLVHLLSPFDPLVIQRKRLQAFFGYEHRFEAYLPPAKRVLGYFALPVLVGDAVVAAIDLKMDRQAGRLLVQRWTWLTTRRAGLKSAIEAALDRFEQFQR